MRTNRGWIRRHWEIATASIVAMASLVSLGGGCAKSRLDVSYQGDPNVSYYRGYANQVDFPTVDLPHAPEVIGSRSPITVRNQQDLQVYDLSLQEAVQSALRNSEIIRSAGTFLALGNNIYTNPNGMPSIYDPAIQESGVLFGGRGVEAALADFDARFQTSMLWGRNEQPQNNVFFGGGLVGANALIQETGNFSSSLSKSFAHGGAISLNHNVNYLGTNAPSLFPSAYSGNFQIQYQLPLLAGAGTEFTRVAGPIGQSFGGLTGVSQGVVIARINNDISIADFELSIRNMIKEVEDAYWDLHLAYQQFNVAVQARESTEEIRRFVSARAGQNVLFADLHQAEDQLFTADTLATEAQSAIYEAEIRLRRLIGRPVNDGEILRPSDEPVSVELIADWYNSLMESLTHRVELRRQKWNIKSLELQLRAAESLTKPRLDFVSGYQVNGFGDDLLGYNDPPLGNFYETLANNDYTGWNLGLQFRWDIGFRSAKAQVRNYELRLAKAHKVLLEQEEEVSLELAMAFQDLARTYQATQISYNRIAAVEKELEIRRLRSAQKDNVDLELRAVLRLGEAQAAYYRNLIEYNKAIANFQLRKGTLLRHNGVLLAEGGWDPAAYEDAQFHSDRRLYAKPNKHLYQEPEAFAQDEPYGGIYLWNQPLPGEEAPVEEAPGVAPVPAATPTPANSPVPAPPAGDADAVMLRGTPRPMPSSGTAQANLMKPAAATGNRAAYPAAARTSLPNSLPETATVAATSPQTAAPRSAPEDIHLPRAVPIPTVAPPDARVEQTSFLGSASKLFQWSTDN